MAPDATAGTAAYVIPSEEHDAREEIRYLESTRNNLLDENETVLDAATSRAIEERVAQIDAEIANVSPIAMRGAGQSTCFVAPNANCSSATLAPFASVWYGAAVLGDVSIGERSGIHDAARVDGQKSPVTIGSDVTVGS